MMRWFRCLQRQWRPVLVSCALLLVATAPAAAQLLDTPWPMFQHNPQHSGQSSWLGPLFPDDDEPPAGNVRFWQGFAALRSSPTIGLGGTIYVAVDAPPEGPAHHGYLCAINPDMTQKWCTMFRADASPSSAAIGADGTIYIGDRDNTLTAFDPDGRKKWLYNNGFEGDLNASPAIGANGTIYVAFGQNLDGHGVFMALNKDLTVKWKCVIGTGVGGSSVAIDQAGFLYQADVSGTLHKFRDSPGPLTSRWCADSVEVWKTPVGGKITGSPVVSPGGVIYIGSNGGLSAVQASDGAILWKFPTPGTVDQTPALAADGTIYFGAKAGQMKTVYAVRPDGTLKWQYGPVALYADRGGFPILGGDGIVYVGLGNGVSAFSPDGVLLWSYPTGDAVLSFPAIGGTATKTGGNGTAVLYLASGDGRLYAISSSRHGENTNDPPVAIAGPDRSGMEVLVGEVLPFDGASSFDPDGDLISFAWDFGDGTSAVGKTVSHAYPAAGTYPVTLTVSDGLAEVSDVLTVAVTAGPPVVGDDFNRPDSTTLGHGWQEVQGDFLINANELRNAPLKATHIAIQPALAGTEQSASAWFASVDNNPSPRFGIVLRFQDSKNYYAFYRQTGGTNALRISRVENGVEKVLAKQTVGPPALDTFFHLGGNASGTTLELILNDVVKLRVTDAKFLRGSVGILLGTGSSSIRQYRVDDFSGRAE